MPAKPITLTAISPNSANYWQRHLTAGVPMALAVTTTFVCSEPEDELAPNSDHMTSIPRLFFSQAPAGTKLFWFPRWLWNWAVTLPHKILAIISSVSSEDNIGVLLWTSWLNITNNIFWIYSLWIGLGGGGLPPKLGLAQELFSRITVTTGYTFTPCVGSFTSPGIDTG